MDAARIVLGGLVDGVSGGSARGREVVVAGRSRPLRGHGADGCDGRRGRCAVCQWYRAADLDPVDLEVDLAGDGLKTVAELTVAVNETWLTDDGRFG